MWRRLVVRRAALALLTLLVISVIVFLGTQALPGDTAHAILGQYTTPEAVAALRKQMHLNDPLTTQYFRWLGGIFRGDLGISPANQLPVSTLLTGELLNSGFLVLVSALIGIPLAIGTGVFMAVRRDRPTEHFLSAIVLFLATLPEFVIAIYLVMVLSLQVFHLVPPVTIVQHGQHGWDNPTGMVLPVLTLVLAITPHIARIMRGSMIEVLESEYVTMARLKGAPERTVIRRHAIPNAIVPALHVAALALAYLAGGVVIVEFVFGYPGIGSALVDGVRLRDIPTVQAISVIIAAVYVVVNFAADALTILLTPKLRTA